MAPSGRLGCGRVGLLSVTASIIILLGLIPATFDMIATRGVLPIRVRSAVNSIPVFNSHPPYTVSDLPDNLNGSTILITGASSGIGYEAASLMVDRGARVVLGTRGGRARLDSLQASLGPGVVAPTSLDLSSFQSIREFVGSLSGAGIDRIDLVLLNAGKMVLGYEEGEAGIEKMLAVHHIGHAYLFELLMPLMLASQHESVRIVFVSSSAHLFSYAEGIRFDSTPDTFGLYFQAYANSKLANALYVRALSHHLEAAYPSKFVVNAVNPGVVSTPFAWYHKYVPSLFSATPQAGAVSVLMPLLDSRTQTDG